eukprot:scaffold6348_cov259-Pinguiococcus_pyrenoidosus.AAC.5
MPAFNLSTMPLTILSTLRSISRSLRANSSGNSPSMSKDRTVDMDSKNIGVSAEAILPGPCRRSASAPPTYTPTLLRPQAPQKPSKGHSL